MQPKVTVVITTYKREPEMVRRALSSVVSQNYPNIEIYVVNDYPDDIQLVSELRQMINEYIDSREIHYIVVDTSGGACKARNIALEKAQGKYFACLDDDDEWLSEKISKQVLRAEEDERIGIVYCNAIIKSEESQKIIKMYEKQQSEGDIFNENLAANNIGSCSFPLFRTEYLREIGGFDTDMPALQDWELYLRLLKNYKAGYVHDVCVIYYRHNGERISRKPEKRIYAYEKIHKKYISELEANKKSASSFYLMGTYFYSFSDTYMAMKYYFRGVKREPWKIKRNIKDFFRMIGRKYIKTNKI